MASMDLVRDVVTCFWTAQDRKAPSDVVNTWTKALSAYSDRQVTEAGHVLVASWAQHRPPMPADLIRLIPSGDTSEEQLDYLMARGSCEQCGHQGLCRKEPADAGIWLCRQCYTGFSTEEIRQKLRDIMEKLG